MKGRENRVRKGHLGEQAAAQPERQPVVPMPVQSWVWQSWKKEAGEAEVVGL